MVIKGVWGRTVNVIAWIQVGGESFSLKARFYRNRGQRTSERDWSPVAYQLIVSTNAENGHGRRLSGELEQCLDSCLVSESNSGAMEMINDRDKGVSWRIYGDNR